MRLQTPSNASMTSGWRLLTAAPHRALFAAGALQLLAVLALWTAELAGRVAPGFPAPAFVVPAPWVHALFMLYGVFPFFIFGFLLTVYPRWMGREPLPRHTTVRTFVPLALGIVAVYAGFFVRRDLVGLGLLLMLGGWLYAVTTLAMLSRRAPDPGAHVRMLNAALAAGALGLAAYLVAILTLRPQAYVIAREAGIWLFLVPVIFTVSHRMIPFFSQSVLTGYSAQRAGWSLPLVGAAALGHFACEVAGWSAWRFVFDVPLALTALHHSWRWNLRRSFEVRLLAMLHLAFLWLGIAMTLYAAQSVALLVGIDLLGRAPLHALGIGFVTGMVVAMVSRVTLGHSGRPLAADRLTWAVLLGIDIVALVRVGAELLPGGAQLNLLAALGWLAVLGAWVARYAPLYFRPRVDGKPG